MRLSNKRTFSINKSCIRIFLFAVCSVLYLISNNYKSVVLVSLSIVLLTNYLIENDKVSIWMFVVATVSILLAIISNDFGKLSLFIFYLFLKMDKLYSKDSIKTYLFFSFIFLILILFLYYGIGFNSSFDRLSWHGYIGNYNLEKSLGFTNPNSCALYCFSLSCIFLIYSASYLSFLFTMIFSYFIYVETDSRTYFFVFFVMWCLLLLFKIFKVDGKKSFLGRIIPFVFIVLCLVSFFVSLFLYKTEFNSILSGRLVINRNFIINGGVTLFGRVAGSSVDSQYIHMLCQKGIIYSIVYMLILFINCKANWITNKNAIILIAVLLCGFTEILFMDPCIMLLICCCIFYSNEGSAYEEKSY